MRGKWEQVNSEHFQYHKYDEHNTLCGEIFKKSGGYRGRYLKDGAWKVIPDLLPTLNSTKIAVEGALEPGNVATH